MDSVTPPDAYAHFFEVKLDVFDGPIDLLLHLVKQNELPIEKVSLAKVASQYLECLEKMRYFDLDVAGEYLVIAATLVSIKSSILLNQPVELVEDEEGNLVDPHEELLNRLREA
ncbi:MAG: segregation/condensation protein A, partial [Proteobacteria bacterium]